jgi:hypothetical protein
MKYSYRMVQVPQNIIVNEKVDPNRAAAQYLESAANDMMGKGWEFYRVDTMSVAVQPGCLASLLGTRASIVNYCVITFRQTIGA